MHISHTDTGNNIQRYTTDWMDIALVCRKMKNCNAHTGNNILCYTTKGMNIALFVENEICNAHTGNNA